MKINKNKIGLAKTKSEIVFEHVLTRASTLSVNGDDSHLRKFIMSFESLTDTAAQDELVAKVDESTAGITNTVNDISTAMATDEQPLTEEETDNLEASIVAAQDPEGYIEAGDQVVDGTTVSSLGGEAEAERAEVTREAFEHHEMQNTLAMTAAYNITPEKQSAAAELFFPTITLDVQQKNYTIDAHLLTVQVNLEYNINGKVPEYRAQKHIIKGLRDAGVLKSGFTDIIPVFRAGVNEEFFVDSSLFPVSEVITDYGDRVETNLLAIGKKVHVLALAQNERQVALGGQDMTDQIAPNPKLKALGVSIGGKAVKFDNLGYHTDSQWTYAPTGDSENIQLSFKSNTNLINGDTKDITGADIPALAALKTNNAEVLLRLAVSGEGNTDYGEFTLSAVDVSVALVRDVTTKEIIDLESTEGQAVVEAIKNADIKIVGWELDATRTNSNIREHGLVLDDRVQRIIYGVKLHSPISVLKNVRDKTPEATESQTLNGLIKTTFIRRSNAAITSIYEILDVLKSLPENLDNTQPFSFSNIGIGQFFVKTYVKDIAIDVNATVQSMQTSDRLCNASAVLTNLMLTEITKAYCNSEMAAALEITDIGSNGFKPHVIAITDNFTRQFICKDGDARTLGDGFDFTIEACSDNRLVSTVDETTGKLLTNQDGEVGTIFMSFGVPKNGANLAIPLWFGNCLDKREIPMSLERSRNSRYVGEIMVQPWFSHICHLPILVRITVKNLKEAVEKRVPFAIYDESRQAATPATPTP